MSEVMQRLGDAINRHDLDAFFALFDTDYRSDQPAHPGRAFRGADRVRENWSAVFAGVPDLTAELVSSAAASRGSSSENGAGTARTSMERPSPSVVFIVVGVDDGLISWGRLYMEPVDEGGQDADRPPA